MFPELSTTKILDANEMGKKYSSPQVTSDYSFLPEKVWTSSGKRWSQAVKSLGYKKKYMSMYIFSYTLSLERLRICSTCIWITKSPELQMSIQKSVKMNMNPSKLGCSALSPWGTAKMKTRTRLWCYTTLVWFFFLACCNIRACCPNSPSTPSTQSLKSQYFQAQKKNASQAPMLKSFTPGQTH